MAIYPRLGAWRKPKKTSGKACMICSSVPAGAQWVEVTWFRGDDEMAAVCDTCRKTRKDEILSWFRTSRLSPAKKAV